MVEMAIMVKMVTMAYQARQAEMAYQARLARMEKTAGMAGMVKMERLERWGSLASKAYLDLLAQAVEGWSTLAGDEQPAPTHQEQSWSMQEGLEEPSIMQKEEQPTTSACQKTRTIYSTRLECRATVQSMGLSTRLMEVVLLVLSTIMMCLVLCVPPPLE